MRAGSYLPTRRGTSSASLRAAAPDRRPHTHLRRHPAHPASASSRRKVATVGDFRPFSYALGQASTGPGAFSVAAGSRGGACPTGRTRRGPVLRFVAAVDLDQLLTVPVIR